MTKVTITLTAAQKWVAIILLALILGPYQTLQASEILIRSLRLGFTADIFYGVDINDARAAQELWLRTVLQNMNKNKEPVDVHIVLYPNMPALINGIKKEEVDAITVFPLEYLSLDKELQLVPSIISYSGDSDGEHYILLTHKNSNIENIEQLRAKKLYIGARGDKKVPLLWLDTTLLKSNLPTSKTFFKSTQYMPKTTQAILPVFFKQADACLVPKTDFETAVKLNPQLGINLQLIAESPGFRNSMACIQKEYYETYGYRIADGMKTIGQTEQGKRFFTLFRVRTMQKFEEAHLENIKNLVQTYHTLHSKSASPQTIKNQNQK